MGKKSVLSFTTYLPSPILPKENDVTLRIYKGLEADYQFDVFKSLNILPFFSKRYKEYKKLKSDKSYNVRSFVINVYTLPDFKNALGIKVRYFSWLYTIFFKKRTFDKYDLIHSNNVFPDFFMGYYTAKRTGIPHCCTVRGKEKQILDFLNLDRKYFLNTYFSTPDPLVLLHFRRYNIPITFIPHGIDDIFFNNNFSVSKTVAAYKFIIVNRLIEMKQINTIIDFFYYFKQCGFNFSCDIIGSGDQKDSLMDQVRRLGLSAELNFLGHQDKDVISKKLKYADFYFTNSRSETFGISMVEALASGCIVVSPKNIGVANLFNNKEFFIEFSHNFEFLKTQIIERQNFLSIYKSYAHKFALDFKWEAMLKKYSIFFEQSFNKE